ncbi:hypothetical protein PR003_g25872 [Phytophthora rubi]|uniref:RxLR effector protein n=1 Tax=Phytophthora rubi TaxID=129364 RepID=A0A6A3H8L3_9STRA|nr:hypothetical protein PR001_g28542 [Phytophthora rubi]KAE9288154.1 hypothetical protein PR003_g25872 [Phytophthora rubi]
MHWRSAWLVACWAACADSIEKVSLSTTWVMSTFWGGLRRATRTLSIDAKPG